MNSLQIVLVTIGIIGLCSALPISLPAESVAPQWIVWSMTLLGAALITVGGCLCCKRKKGFKEFNNEPGTASHVVSAESPFPIFRPLNQGQPTQHGACDNQTEATPLKHPEGASGGDGADSPVLPHSNHVTPNTGLLNQLPNEQQSAAYDCSDTVPNPETERLNNFEPPAPQPPRQHISPINNIASIRNNMQIISNAIINIVTHDQIEIDNNNGPISELDIQNIANNNAEGYIRNQNEIYENQNLEVARNDEILRPPPPDENLMTENYQRNLYEPSCSTDVFPSTSACPNVTNVDYTNFGAGESGDNMRKETPNATKSDLDDSACDRFSKDLSFPEFSPSRNLSINASSVMNSVCQETSYGSPPYVMDKSQADDVNEALRVLESVLSGESDCDSLSCSSLCEVQLDFGNDNSTDDLRDTSERFIRDIDIDSREASKAPDVDVSPRCVQETCVVNLEDFEYQNDEKRDTEVDKENFESNNRQFGENATIDVESLKHINQIKSELINITESVKIDDVITKSNEIMTECDEQNDLKKIEIENGSDTVNNAVFEGENADLIISEGKAAELESVPDESVKTRDDNLTVQNSSTNVVNFQVDPVRSSPDKSEDFLTPEHQSVPRHTMEKPVKLPHLGFSNAKHDDGSPIEHKSVCDNESDLMKTLSSPEVEFDLDTKTIEVLESLNITTSTPVKTQPNDGQENGETPSEVVSIRKELLQKKLCYDPAGSPARKPNYAFLKSGQINLESWDKFLGDSFERSNEEDDFEFDILDDHNDICKGNVHNATYTKESSEEIANTAGGDEDVWESNEGFSDKENVHDGTFIMKDSTIDSDSDLRYNTSSGNEDEDSEKIAEIRRTLIISLPGAQGPSTKDVSSGVANGTKSAQNTPDNVVQAQKRNILGILDAGFGLGSSSFQFPDYFINEANGTEERNEIYIRYNAGGVGAGGVLSPIAEDWSGEDNEEEEEGEASEAPELKISSATATESAGRTFVINDHQGGDNSSTSYSDRSALTSDKPRQVLGSWCSNDTLFNVEDALDVEKITSPAENNDASYENCVVISPQTPSKHPDSYLLDREVNLLENDVSIGQEGKEELENTDVDDSKNCDVEKNISANETFPTVVESAKDMIEKSSEEKLLEIHLPENKTESIKDEEITIVLNNGEILKSIDSATRKAVNCEQTNSPQTDVIKMEEKCDTTKSVQDFENVKLELSKLDTVSSDFVDVESGEPEEVDGCCCPDETTSADQENFVQKSNISNQENIENNVIVNVNHNPETNRIVVKEKHEQNLNANKETSSKTIDVPEINCTCAVAPNEVIKENNIKSAPNKIERNIVTSENSDLSDKENDRRFNRNFVKQMNGEFLSNEQNFSNTSIVLRTSSNVNTDDNVAGNKRYLIKKSDARLDLLRDEGNEIKKIGNKISVNNHMTNGSAHAEDDENEDSSSEHENEDTISSNTDDYDTLTSSSQSGQEYELHGDIIEEDDDNKCDYEIEVTRDALDTTFTLDGENDPWICNIKFSDNDMMTTSFSSESPLPSPRTQDGVLEKFQDHDQEPDQDEENLDDDTGWESEDTSCEFEWKSGDSHHQAQQPVQEESTDMIVPEDQDVASGVKEELKNGDVSNKHVCPSIRIDEFMEDGTFESVEQLDADADATLDDTMVTARTDVSKNEFDEEIEENDEEYDESSDDGSEEIEFVPSTWNSLAMPARSSLKTPDSSSDKSKKGRSVVFKKEKYMSVYEYPREQEHCTYIEPMYDSSLSYAPNGPVQCFDRFFVTSTTLPFNEYEFYPTTKSDTSKDFNTGDQFNWLSQHTATGGDPFDSEDLLNSATDFDLQGTMDTEYNKAGSEDDQFSLDPMPGGADDDGLYEFTAQNLDNFDQDSPWTASGNEEVTSFISPDTPDSNNSQINLKFRSDGPKNTMNVADFATPDSGIEVTPNPDNHNKSMKFAEIGNELKNSVEDSKNIDTRSDVTENFKESKEFNNIDNLGMLCHTKSLLKLPLKVHDVKTSEEDVNDDSQESLEVNETPDSTNHKNNVAERDDNSSNYKSAEGDVGMNEMNQNEELINEQDAVQSVDNFENTLNSLKQSLDMAKVSDKINSDLLLSDVGSANSGDEDSGIDSATTLIDMNSRS